MKEKYLFHKSQILWDKKKTVIESFSLSTPFELFKVISCCHAKLFELLDSKEISANFVLQKMIPLTCLRVLAT